MIDPNEAWTWKEASMKLVAIRDRPRSGAPGPWFFQKCVNHDRRMYVSAELTAYSLYHTTRMCSGEHGTSPAYARCVPSSNIQ